MARYIRLITGIAGRGIRGITPDGILPTGVIHGVGTPGTTARHGHGAGVTTHGTGADPRGAGAPVGTTPIGIRDLSRPQEPPARIVRTVVMPPMAAVIEAVTAAQPPVHRLRQAVTAAVTVRAPARPTTARPPQAMAIVPRPAQVHARHITAIIAPMQAV